jgi:hypothetical protein
MPVLANMTVNSENIAKFLNTFNTAAAALQSKRRLSSD